MTDPQLGHTLKPWPKFWFLQLLVAYYHFNAAKTGDILKSNWGAKSTQIGQKPIIYCTSKPIENWNI